MNFFNIFKNEKIEVGNKILIKKFAWKPVKINDKIIWLKNYYSLYIYRIEIVDNELIVEYCSFEKNIENYDKFIAENATELI